MKGKKLWEEFKTVFLLTKQMWQSQDEQYQELLRRVRKGEITKADYAWLISKVSRAIEFNINLLKIIT